MKNNVELGAALNMVLARLDSNPKTEVEWTIIAEHLAQAAAYAVKQEDIWAKAEASLRNL